jgi:kinesin family protein 3/17
MEGKLLKGEARGGLLELTQRKEEEIKRREVELAKRCELQPRNRHKPPSWQ